MKVYVFVDGTGNVRLRIDDRAPDIAWEFKGMMFITLRHPNGDEKEFEA